MPDPLSPKMGLGMKVAVLPHLWATFLTTCLYHMVRSAMVTSGPNTMDSSPWPAVATSWWKTSTVMPSFSRVRAISARMSVWESMGDTGK